jgi:glycogen operon protein
VEGKTTKKSINQLRSKMMRNALTLLLLSQGTPMIQAGDEFGNSQQGNNNAYCQDNELGWVDWKQKKTNNSLVDYCKSLINLRKLHPVFHNCIELKGLDYIACGHPDVSFHGKKAWYPDYSNYSRLIAIMLNGEYAMIHPSKKDETCFVICNMHWEPQEFDLPEIGKGNEWELFFTTEDGFLTDKLKVLKKSMAMKPRTIALLIERKKN